MRLQITKKIFKLNRFFKRKNIFESKNLHFPFHLKRDYSKKMEIESVEIPEIEEIESIEERIKETQTTGVDVEESDPKKAKQNELVALDELDEEINEEFEEEMSEKIYAASELIQKGDVRGLDEFIQNTPTLHEHGTTVLHMAAMAGNAEFIKSAILQYNFNRKKKTLFFTSFFLSIFFFFFFFLFIFYLFFIK